MRLPKYSVTLLHKLTDIAFAAACVILVLQVVSIFIAVVLRFTGGSQIPGLLTFSEWSLLYFAFFAAPKLARCDEHVSMDFLVERTNQTVRWLLTIFALVVGLTVFTVIAVVGSTVTYDMWVSKEADFFKVRGVPLASIMWVIPAGSLLIAGELAVSLARLIVAGRQPDQAEDKTAGGH